MSPLTAAWFSTPSIAGLEIVALAGYHTVVFDAEHGTFELHDLNQILPFARALGLRTLVKTAAPERVPIQQALDFGADGVILPHIIDAAHAEEVCSYAKLPPMGDRSLAGGRTMNYSGFDAEWSNRQNTSTLCLPMIEDPRALDDVEAILALPAVDGIFIGPGDLFARRGGGGYQYGEFEDSTLRSLGRAAVTAGKPWLMPAWSEAEQRLAIEEGADTVVLLQEFAALRSGFTSAAQRFEDLQS
jgi:4-hydroxy-2-oxoheptanedioate aldolase